MLLLTVTILPTADYFIFGGQYGVALIEHLYWGSHYIQHWWH
jgi:hypothetical protein